VSHSPDAEDFVVGEWRAALQDAGVAEDDFHLITCPGAAVSGHPKAASFDKGEVFYGHEDEGGLVVRPDKLAEANDEANRWRHRVAIYEDIDDEDVVERAYLAGLLRHEIEHGKQRDAEHEVFGLIKIVALACRKVPTGNGEHHRDLVNASPIESDANAAASAFVRQRYPEAVDELLAGSDHYLVDATAPPTNPRTLVERTVEYLWQFQEICDDPSNLQPDRTFADILDNHVPGGSAGDLWRRLQEAGSG
jgi:hypothetical protein